MACVFFFLGGCGEGSEPGDLYMLPLKPTSSQLPFQNRVLPDVAPVLLSPRSGLARQLAGDHLPFGSPARAL